MPCEYYSRSELVSPEWKSIANVATRNLCALCQILEDGDLGGIIDDAGARAWWDGHKERDADRKRDEEAELEQARKRQEVLGKLTPSERDALGV